MKKILLNTFLFLQFAICAKSINITKQADPVPVSPNASSLGIFGAIPVGHYTGIPDISIPIYEINLDGKKIPISLSYHASGIRVNQEASWVGLGWALNACGMISRQVQDGIDFGPAMSYDTRTGYYYAPRLSTYFGYNDDYTKVTDISAFADDMETTDTEPDLYTFNFGSHSGVMMTGRENSEGNSSSVAQGVIRQPKEFLNIKYLIDEDKWVAYDGDGYSYYFSSKEKTTNYSQSIKNTQSKASEYIRSESLNRSFVSVQSDWPISPATSSWLLDSIKSPLNNKIAFSYKYEEIETPISYLENMVLSLGGIGDGKNTPNCDPGITHGYFYSIIKQAVLNKITFNDGEILFKTSDRYDLRSTKESGYPDFAQKLETITVKNGLGEGVKNISFSYKYLGNEESNYTCRLLLNSIQINNQSPYLFEYNMGELPAKHSLNTDYWGYYNGPQGITHKQPMYYLNASPSIALDYAEAFYPETSRKYVEGRNKTPNINYLMYGMLTTIQYPTKGKTYFTYESNDFNDSNNFNLVERLYTEKEVARLSFLLNSEEDIIDPNPNSERDAKELYSNDFEINTFVHQNVLRLSYSKTYSSNQSSYDNVNILFRIERKNSNGEYESVPIGLDDNAVFKTFGLNPIGDNNLDILLKPLSKGIYRFVLTKNPGLNYYCLNLSFNCFLYNVDENGNMQGGGIRIKEIKNLLNDKAEIKTYKYTMGDNTSSGLLMTKPLYHKIVIEPVPGSLYYWLYATSDSYSPNSFSAQGAPVGYSYVEELNGIDKSQGFTSYDFFNDTDYVQYIKDRAVNKFPVYPSLNNGLISKISVFDSNGSCLSATTYEYSMKKNSEIQGIKRYIVPIKPTEFNILGGKTGQFKLYSQKSELWSLDKETSIEYSNTGNLKKEKLLTYDSVYHVNNEVQTTMSNGKTLTMKYKYPFDFHDNISNKMFNSNMLEVPVEEITLKDSKVISANKVIYTDSLGLLAPKQYFSFAGKNIDLNNYTKYYQLESSLGYYSSNGKLGYKVGIDNIPVVYLWGYNNLYPVAKIEGLTYEKVMSILKESYIKALSLNNSITLSNGSYIRSLLSPLGAQVTSYTYRPLVGVLTNTQPNGVTFYYDYDSSGRLKQTYTLDNSTRKILQHYEYQYKK